MDAKLLVPKDPQNPHGNFSIEDIAARDCLCSHQFDAIAAAERFWSRFFEAPAPLEQLRSCYVDATAVADQPEGPKWCRCGK